MGRVVSEPRSIDGPRAVRDEHPVADPEQSKSFACPFPTAGIEAQHSNPTGLTEQRDGVLTVVWSADIETSRRRCPERTEGQDPACAHSDRIRDDPVTVDCRQIRKDAEPDRGISIVEPFDRSLARIGTRTDVLA